ncbi:DoxX family protein [Paenibacillus aestuarii]|uniref:DoxX family protein n=1 Tax=Paenibacillus aestuarii TaxID=516965 RepID=A0ABW0KEJ8_9BACL|nr:DoxX family protein [Paenibacillus aestuarii]
MVPFIALLVSGLLFRLFGAIGWNYFNSWQASLQAAVAVMLLLTASAHWGAKRKDLVQMVPPAFPNREWIVTATGWLEIAGAIGILIPATSAAASVCLAILLLAMFPANIRAAREKLTIGGRPVPMLFPRTLIQIVFLAAVILASPAITPF